MNTERNSSINKNLDQTFSYGYAFSPSAADLDISFYEEDELSDEQLALKRLYHGLAQNNQYQQRLQDLLQSIQAKIEKNNQKLEKVTEIIAFKNKRNKLQLKKKQIEFYKYEDPKLPPESFRIFERIKHSKGKKNFQNLYKTLIQDSSSENEFDDEDALFKAPGESEKDYKEEILLGGGGTESVSKEPRIKKESQSLSKSPQKRGSQKKSIIKKSFINEDDDDEGDDRSGVISANKSNMYYEEDDEDDNDLEDDLDMEIDSEDELRSIKKRGDRLGLDKFLEEYKGKDPTEIDWLALARKINSRSLMVEKGSLVTALDLYRRFISEEVQLKRVQWTDEEDKELLNAVKIHGTNNWKQLANSIEGKNTYLCFQRWAKFVNPEISKGKWNLDEDLRLALAVECFKPGNWIEISSLFKNRTDVQCRERWCNILDPNLNGKEWAKQEDELLILGVIKYGKRWAQVSKMLKNRTDNQCWRRWKILSKTSKEVKKMMNDKIYGTIGMDQIKVNMKEPFKVEKRLRREVDVIQSKEQQQQNSGNKEVLTANKDDSAVVVRKPREKKSSKKSSKKAAKGLKETEDVE